MNGITRPLTALSVTLLLVAAAGPVRAQSGPRGKPSSYSLDSLPAMSREARAYLATALDTIEVTSMHRATIDWSVVRDSAFMLAAGARGPSDTYGAIQWALRRVDKHSFLQARFPWIDPMLIDGRFGYVRVPSYSGPPKAALTDSLQEALRNLDGRGACGWIVDLRMNRGGNVWPMTAGIGPLLGDSVVNRALTGPARTVYVDGAAIEVDSSGKRQVISSAEHPYLMRHPLVPVAVLLDGGIASSAEAIAIAFRPRPNTRFFGQPTAGYSTANSNAKMSDGANLVVTIGVMTDRAGRAYGSPIEPDDTVNMPEGWWPSPVDAVARRATTWLGGRLECSAKQ